MYFIRLVLFIRVCVLQHIDGGRLQMINVTFADAGDYECTVVSAVGRIKTQTLVVIEGPPGPPGKLIISISYHW